MSGGEVLGMQVKRLPSGKDRNTGELIVESMYFYYGIEVMRGRDINRSTSTVKFSTYLLAKSEKTCSQPGCNA